MKTALTQTVAALAILLPVSFAQQAYQIDTVFQISQSAPILGFAVDPVGNVYFSSGDQVWRRSVAGITTPYAGSGGRGFFGDGGPAVSALLAGPRALALDSATGALYIYDALNFRVRVVSSDGTISTAFQTTAPLVNGDSDMVSLAVDPQKRLYLLSSSGSVARWAQGVLAQKDTNFDVAYDHLGLIADNLGNIYTPTEGSLYRLNFDSVGPNETVPMIRIGGTGFPGYFGDGGQALGAQVRPPGGIAVDQAGTVFFTDTSRIRSIDAAGIIRTIAGSGIQGFSGDGGPALQARISTYLPLFQTKIHGFLALDGVGNIYFLDNGNNRVRKLTPMRTTPPPSITGAASAAGYGSLSSFASGSWLEIKGQGLASITREWQSSDFNGVNAPTSLGGVSVTINGKPGFIYYIKPDDQSGPSQVNMQAPDDTAVGPVGITVTNSAGVSNTFIVQKTTLAPGMLAPPSFNVGGKQYLVATFGLQYLFVGSPNLVSGAPFQQAKPHDIIWLYGIGFGEVDPPMAAGVIAPSTDKLKAQVAVRFDQTPANVTYAGHYPGYVGLYLFIVEVPDVPDGDRQIGVTVNGQALSQPMFLTVRR